MKDRCYKCGNKVEDSAGRCFRCDIAPAVGVKPVFPQAPTAVHVDVATEKLQAAMESKQQRHVRVLDVSDDGVETQERKINRLLEQGYYILAIKLAPAPQGIHHYIYLEKIE